MIKTVSRTTRRVFFVLIIFILLGFVVVKYYYDYKKPISGEISDMQEASISFFVETFDTSTPSPSGETGTSTSSKGGGGSGGPSVEKKTPDFIVDQALIKVISTIGDSFKKSLTIKNPNSQSLKFSIDSNLGDFLFFSENEFEIPANSEKTIFLTFLASEDLKPDVYTGKVILESQFTKKEVPVIYEVQSRKSLFDVSINIPAEYKNLNQGDEVFFQVTLINLGEIGRVDLDLEYQIKDFDGNIILEFTEKVAVETQASFSKTIYLPENLNSGDYVIAVKVKHGLNIGTASDVLSVFDKRSLILSVHAQLFIFFGIFLIILLLIFVVYELRRRKYKDIPKKQNEELSKLNTRINEKKINRDEISVEMSKLKSQQSLLDEAFKKGYISRKSYDDGKARIYSMLNKLKKRL